MVFEDLFCSFIFTRPPCIFIPIHICFYPSKWRVDGSRHKAMLHSPCVIPGESIATCTVLYVIVSCQIGLMHGSLGHLWLTKAGTHMNMVIIEICLLPFGMGHMMCHVQNAGHVSHMSCGQSWPMKTPHTWTKYNWFFVIQFAIRCYKLPTDISCVCMHTWRLTIYIINVEH